MARKNATSLAELFTMLDAQIKSAASDENNSVGKLAVNTGKDSVQRVVYDVYTTGSYPRTGDLKERSWRIESTSDGIMIYNARTNGQGKQIAHIVHTGEGYTQQFPYAGVPRPFMDDLAEQLKGSGELSSAFMDDLRKRGFTVVR